MSKIKQKFQCNYCNYNTLKWLGCCPGCNKWETLKEVQQSSLTKKIVSKNINVQNLETVPTTTYKRMLCNIIEWDRVIGGGIVPGSFLVLTGDPGIGKSTLLLQISDKLSQNYKALYFSSEESLQQIKARALRLGIKNSQLLFSDEANLHNIIATTEQIKPYIIIIDSIQNCYIKDTQTTPGSIGQLKESTFLLMRLAKENNIAIIISGHITKNGTIAGPKTLEHMVDGVFYLRGEDRWQTRVLRSVKNRFGSTGELGFFSMQSGGLEQVKNINEQLISEITNCPGSVLVSVMEGSQPLLLELQALTIKSKLAIPQRVISGIDHKQVVLIAAILEKYLDIKLSLHDIFFKVGGGFKIKGSSTDLGIALALLSSYFKQPLPEKSIALGEISLTGQIKPINKVATYINEAKKFGIRKFLIAETQDLKVSDCIIEKFSNVYELLKLFIKK